MYYNSFGYYSVSCNVSAYMKVFHESVFENDISL